MISLIRNDSLSYPGPEAYFSPDTAFPEYPFTHISARKNPVYRAVRECLAQAGLDSRNFGASDWNPLGAFIKPGDKVFALCNFVFHRLGGESAEGFAAKCTHGAVLRPLLDYLCLAAGKDGSVCFGNAPMQKCRWESVISETGAGRILEFYRREGMPVEAEDLRLFVAQKNRIGGISRVERRPESDGVTVELGEDSLMAGLDGIPDVRYRIMNYGTQRLEELHGRGRHAYVIHRRILEADCVFSLSKLKTHEKVGLTAALKNCVGAVGHKDSLPHHRFGSPAVGGDEYPANRAGLLHAVSSLHDRIQKIPPDRPVGGLLRTGDRIVRKIAGKMGAVISEGGWWGNDTAWRMVLDLARIVQYAAESGKTGSSPFRKYVSLVDGIIAGEGEGPLFPDPVRAGVLFFCDNPAISDYAASLLMGFDPDRIPLIREAFKLEKLPLCGESPGDAAVVCNGERCLLGDLAPVLERPFMPPFGWRGKIHREQAGRFSTGAG